MESWTSPSVLVAAVAAIASAIISWLVFRHQRAEGDITPHVHCSVTHKEGDCFKVTVSPENFGPTEWEVEEVTVLKPRQATIARESLLQVNAGVFTGLGKDMVVYDHSLTGRRAELRYVLRTATTAGRYSKDRVHLHLMLNSPEAERSRKLSMRVKLRSRDAVERRREIAIRRTLPVLTSRIAE